jgi:hypothetical protein
LPKPIVASCHKSDTSNYAEETEAIQININTDTVMEAACILVSIKDFESSIAYLQTLRLVPATP